MLFACEIPDQMAVSLRNRTGFTPTSIYDTVCLITPTEYILIDPQLRLIKKVKIHLTSEISRLIIIRNFHDVFAIFVLRYWLRYRFRWVLCRSVMRVRIHHQRWYQCATIPRRASKLPNKW